LEASKIVTSITVHHFLDYDESGIERNGVEHGGKERETDDYTPRCHNHHPPPASRAAARGVEHGWNDDVIGLRVKSKIGM
jgi:hypothetical protein